MKKKLEVFLSNVITKELVTTILNAERVMGLNSPYNQETVNAIEGKKVNSFEKSIDIYMLYKMKLKTTSSGKGKSQKISEELNKAKKLKISERIVKDLVIEITPIIYEKITKSGIEEDDLNEAIKLFSKNNKTTNSLANHIYELATEMVSNKVSRQVEKSKRSIHLEFSNQSKIYRENMENNASVKGKSIISFLKNLVTCGSGAAKKAHTRPERRM